MSTNAQPRVRPAHAKYKVAVIGDTWKSTFAHYMPTSRVPPRGMRGASSAATHIPDTSLDLTIQDGVFVAASLLSTLFHIDEHVDYRIVVPRISYTPSLNRLVNLVSVTTPSQSSVSPSGRVPLLISGVKYLNEAAPPSALPTIVKEIQTHNKQWVPRPSPQLDKTDSGPASAMLVIDDNGEWRQSYGTGSRIALTTDAPLVVVLGGGLPSVSNSCFADPGWRTLISDAEHRQCYAILSATMLRSSRAHIRRRLTWEQTLHDLVSELTLSKDLAFLRTQCNIVVRFGTLAAALMRKSGRGVDVLVYDPRLPLGLERSPSLVAVLGKSTMIACSLLRHLLIAKPPPSNHDLVVAIKQGLDLIGRRHARGYMEWLDASSDDPNSHNLSWNSLLENPPLDEMACKPYIFGRAPLLTAETAASPLRTFAQCSFSRAVPNDRWSILGDLLRHSRSHRPTISAINLAEAIVLAGPTNVFNRVDLHDSVKCVLTRPRFVSEYSDITERRISDNYTMCKHDLSPEQCVFVPVFTCGSLVSVDRKEIECLRAVYNLIASYVDSGRGVPLSLAVFGRPGSGKSYAIKALANQLRQGKAFGLKNELVVHEVNMAQMGSIDNLEDVMQLIREENVQQRIPLVFLDEFDCACNGRNYGWLHCFLSAMHDGTFKSRSRTVRTGRAILCFAGGTAHCFEDFKAQVGNHEFLMAKGPDFISRLRGFVNILSIGKEKGNPMPIIRRALLLRSLLERIERVEMFADKVLRAMIDEDIVYALLTVSEYRHEARSMQAILEMCTPFHGMINKVSLPYESHLGMHVDAKEFHGRMNRSRARERAWP